MTRGEPRVPGAGTGEGVHSARRDILERVQRRLDSCRAARPGQRVLVACSGGLDSTVLLDVLSRMAERRALHLRVAHVDHRVRPDSWEDALFVRELAAARALDSYIGVVDPDVLPRDASPEERLRAARHRLLEAEAVRWKADWLAVGHHADDQAEWMLMRMLQGSTPDGWVMEPARPPWIRPLFDVWREDLLGYATMRGLAWREDSSNRDLAVPRNRIRHQTLPWLEAHGAPALRKSLVACAAELREDADHLARESAALLHRARLGEGQAISLTVLADRPPALVRRAVALWLRTVVGIEARRSVVAEVLELVRRTARVGGGLDLGDGLRIERREATVELVGRPSHQRAPGRPTARVEGDEPF